MREIPKMAGWVVKYCSGYGDRHQPWFDSSSRPPDGENLGWRLSRFNIIRSIERNRATPEAMRVDGREGARERWCVSKQRRAMMRIRSLGSDHGVQRSLEMYSRWRGRQALVTIDVIVNSHKVLVMLGIVHCPPGPFVQPVHCRGRVQATSCNHTWLLPVLSTNRWQKSI